MNQIAIRRIDPPAAWAMLRADPRVLLIDIRSTAEFTFVGHPRDGVHVPWVDEPDWEENPDFVKDVRMHAADVVEPHEILTAPILLICRSGKRSVVAAWRLVQHGFRNVWSVDEGFEGDLDDDQHRGTFNGWRHHGLPWAQF